MNPLQTSTSPSAPEEERRTPEPNLFFTDAEGLADGSRPAVIRLHDGDHLDLEITPVRTTLGESELRMLAYNGSIPGPTLQVDQGARITVTTRNLGDVET